MFYQMFTSGFLPARSGTACLHRALEDGQAAMAAAWEDRGHLLLADTASPLASPHQVPSEAHATCQAASVTRWPILTWVSLDKVLRSWSLSWQAGTGVARSVRLNNSFFINLF